MGMSDFLLLVVVVGVVAGAHGGSWPDADLRQRQLLGLLFGVKRTRYAQACYFRV